MAPAHALLAVLVTAIWGFNFVVDTSTGRVIPASGIAPEKAPVVAPPVVVVPSSVQPDPGQAQAQGRRQKPLSKAARAAAKEQARQLAKQRAIEQLAVLRDGVAAQITFALSSGNIRITDGGGRSAAENQAGLGMDLLKSVARLYGNAVLKNVRLVDWDGLQDSRVTLRAETSAGSFDYSLGAVFLLHDPLMPPQSVPSPDQTGVPGARLGTGVSGGISGGYGGGGEADPGHQSGGGQGPFTPYNPPPAVAINIAQINQITTTIGNQNIINIKGRNNTVKIVGQKGRAVSGNNTISVSQRNR